MNSTALIVDYDPFAMESRMYVVKDGKHTDRYTITSSIPELAEKLVQYAKELNIYDIKVRGPFAITGEIQRSVAQHEMRTYNENKITMEGI